ncbi:MAG: hypothetical protein VYE22_04805 [Myxococcota bacterium]|nr:hypothetical protein [Myxococcota bacterium]
MPYRDDAEAQARHVEALTQERDEALARLERARAALASVVAEMSALPPEADIPWRSLHGGEPLRVTFVNETDETLSLRWVSYDGREREEVTLVAGGEREVDSFVAHLWRLVDRAGAIRWQGYLRADRPRISARRS